MSETIDRVPPLETVSTAATVPTKCAALSRQGLPCKRRALPGKKHCAQHDPELEETRRAELQEMGKNSADKKKAKKRALIREAVLTSALDLRKELEEVLTQVKQSDASAIEKANATARLVLAALAVNRHLDLEGEVEELRRFVAEQLGKEPSKTNEDDQEANLDH